MINKTFFIIVLSFLMLTFGFSIAFAKKDINEACTTSSECESDFCSIPEGVSSGTCQTQTTTGTTTTTTTSAMLTNPLGVTSVPELVGRVLKYVLGLTGSVALIVFIYGGVLMMFSGGKPENVTKGKDAIMWAVVGLAIIFASYAILDFVIDALTGVSQ